MMATSHTTPSIFFASVPDFKDLCSVTLHVNESLSQSAGGDRNASKYVGSQPQIIKCRADIYRAHHTGVTFLQQEGHIYVVLQQSVWKSGRLQARCQKMGLQVSKPMRVICAVFQACLAYTIRAKLAPLWNKIGNWYMQGRDFLVRSGYLAAVDMEVNVTEAEICLALKPTMAKLPQCSLGDFEVCLPVLEQFFLSKNSVISEYSIDNKWCHVLPSLKKGQVVSISQEIPATSPFKTYKDIKRYWKNAYGYRLPESSTGVLYYNMYFPAIGPTLFTYPEYCIRKHELILQPRMDPAPILNAFLTDLQYKLPSVCGAVFEVTPKAQYTNMGLYQTGKEAHPSRLSLSSTPPPTSVHRIPTRQITFQGYPSVSGYAATTTVPQPFISTSRLPTRPPSATVRGLDASFCTTSHASTQPLGDVSHTVPHVDGSYSMPSHDSYSQPQGLVCRSSQGLAPIGPYISPNQTPSSYQAVLPGPHHSNPRPVPSSHQPVVGQDACFKPVLPDHSVNCRIVACNNTYVNNIYGSNPCSSTTYCNVLPATNMNTNRLSIQTAAVAPPRIVPRFVSQRPRTSYTVSGVSSNEQASRTIPRFTPTKKAILHLKKPHSVSAFTSVSGSSAQYATTTDRDAEKDLQDVAANKREGQAVFKPAFMPSSKRKEPSRVKRTQQTLDAVLRKKPKTQQGSQEESKTVKRKPKDDGIEVHTPGKKPRAKPKVQEGIDVTSLAINDQLSKVNTVTLTTWLKEKGIAVKAKDKKADLVQKVLEFINLNSMED